MHLPEGAGFSIGPRTGIRTAVLQVCFDCRRKIWLSDVRLQCSRHVVSMVVSTVLRTRWR